MFYHLLDPVEALPVEAEGLFEQHLVLHRPLVWKRGEVWQVGQRLLDVVFVPEEHAKRLNAHTHSVNSLQTLQCVINRTYKESHLLHVVSVFLFGDSDVFVHCGGKHTQSV